MQFTDGWKVDLSGPYRALEGPDGWYMVGQGMMIPCETQAEAEALAQKMAEKTKK